MYKRYDHAHHVPQHCPLLIMDQLHMCINSVDGIHTYMHDLGGSNSKLIVHTPHLLRPGMVVLDHDRGRAVELKQPGLTTPELDSG